MPLGREFVSNKNTWPLWRTLVTAWCRSFIPGLGQERLDPEIHGVHEFFQRKIPSETNDANSPKGASNKDIVTNIIQYNFTLSPNYPLEAETTSSCSCSLVVHKKN